MITTEAGLARDNPGLVWTAALIVAGLGAYIMYAAMPGVNWGIWTAAASAGLILVARARGTLGGSTFLTVATATLLAAGAGVTADPLMHGLICLAVVLFLSLAMLLAVDPRLERISAPFVISSPFVAGGNAAGESFRRLVDLSGMFRSTRARAAVRGAAITIPIVLFFALLLAGADPVFATWRDQIARIITAWSFVPRLIFFCALLVVVLGAYSFAVREPAPVSRLLPESSVSANDSDRRLGATEGQILITAISALFWLFIAVQLSYLFGNVPSMPGSGITFAEYAHRGFSELTIVVTCSVLLIVASERYGRSNGHAGWLKAVTLALLVAVAIMLVSAFHRVSLYEAGYGYTVSRLYAQVYMLVLGAGLLALGREVTGTLDTGRLFRRVFIVATAAFTVLIFWNHESWIASANIDRPAATGKLDVGYITRDLSANAIPVVVSRLATLAEPARTELRQALVSRYGSGRKLREDRWFEWNLRRHQARAALSRIGLPLPTGAPAVIRTTTN